MSFEMSLAVLAAITGLAAWKGEWPERSVAAILVASLVADQLFHWRFPDTITYVTVDLWHLALDILMFAGFMAVALYADRFWTLWVSSAQLIAVVAHLLRRIDTEMHQLIYAIFLQAPYWLAMVLLLWGTTNLQWLRAHERRRLARRAARGGDVSR